MSPINRYCVEYPEIIEIEELLIKHVNDYNKKLVLYIFICEWKLKFMDTVIRVKSSWMCSGERAWKILKYLSGRNFSHILEMNITFIIDLRYMTYEHYLKQPKPMIEWLF